MFEKLVEKLKSKPEKEQDLDFPFVLRIFRQPRQASVSSSQTIVDEKGTRWTPLK